MIGTILMYAASFILLSWGLAHLFPTRSVVKGFGEISTENNRIITMEWIIEGMTLVFISFLVAVTTYLDRTSHLANAIYSGCIVILNLLSIVSLFTGFRNSFIAFKLCPFIFTGASLLIALGAILN